MAPPTVIGVRRLVTLGATVPGRLKENTSDGRVRATLPVDGCDFDAFMDTWVARILLSQEGFELLCCGGRHIPVLEKNLKPLCTLSGEPIPVTGKTTLVIWGTAISANVFPDLRHKLLL